MVSRECQLQTAEITDINREERDQVKLDYNTSK